MLHCKIETFQLPSLPNWGESSVSHNYHLIARQFIIMLCFQTVTLNLVLIRDTHILYSHVCLFTRIFRSIVLLLAHHTYIYWQDCRLGYISVVWLRVDGL